MLPCEGFFLCFAKMFKGVCVHVYPVVLCIDDLCPYDIKDLSAMTLTNNPVGFHHGIALRFIL
jgi:hypothetical protein